MIHFNPETRVFNLRLRGSDYTLMTLGLPAALAEQAGYSRTVHLRQG